jgi:hypothetical protein
LSSTIICAGGDMRAIYWLLVGFVAFAVLMVAAPPTAV